MKWTFEESSNQELELVVRKSSYDEEVQAVLAHLSQFGQERVEVFPVKAADRLQLVRVADLILVEVEGGSLRLYTTAGQLTTTERLNHLMERVSHPDLLQISRYALINLRHLDYLEASFSGNMTAFLTGKVKTTVSRRYLKTLEKTLGL